MSYYWSGALAATSQPKQKKKIQVEIAYKSLGTVPIKKIKKKRNRKNPR